MLCPGSYDIVENQPGSSIFILFQGGIPVVLESAVLCCDFMSITLSWCLQRAVLHDYSNSWKSRIIFSTVKLNLNNSPWFDPRRLRQHSFVEIDREIFSTVILSLPLIQEGQFNCQFLAKEYAHVHGNRLED